jgi:hypothetical protein
MSTIQSLDWSIIQNSDWTPIIATVVCLILIVAIVIEHRRLSLLKREVQRMSEDVKNLAATEQRRFMLELKSARQNEQKRVA